MVDGDTSSPPFTRELEPKVLHTSDTHHGEVGSSTVLSMTQKSCPRFLTLTHPRPFDVNFNEKRQYETGENDWVLSVDVRSPSPEVPTSVPRLRRFPFNDRKDYPVWTIGLHVLNVTEIDEKEGKNTTF